MKSGKSIKPRLLLILVILGAGVGGWFLQSPPSPQGPEKNRAERGVTKTTAVEQVRVFEDFARWSETFAQAGVKDRATLTAGGLKLALQRRAVMETLIRDDPRQALAQAVTLDVWQSLPLDLQREVEEPFSALADFRVLPVCANGASAGDRQPEATRLTEIDGLPALDSYVFGRRVGLPTKENSPVQGIRLGNLAALRENVFHELTASEVKTAEALYPLANPRADRDFSTDATLGAEPVTALAGGRMFIFSDRAGLDRFEASIARMDEKPGPHSGAAVLFLPTPEGDSAGYDLENAITTNNLLASAWTETKKKVFMIRCDFLDKPDGVFPVVGAGVYGTLLNTTVSDTIRAYSYGKTWIEATVSASVTRMPLSAAYYAVSDINGTSRNTQLLADAKAAYQAANPSFVPSSYDIIGVWFVSSGMTLSGMTYAGVAGGSDLWIQGSSDAGVHVHEFGHNYGLGHSSFWTPPAGSLNPVNPAGTNDEYGDGFDVMGKGGVPEGVFHSEAKQRLNWLATGEWTDATAGGNNTYRIHRIDHPDTVGVRGLRVTKGGGDYYWLSYRRNFQNDWLKAGANIVWQRAGQNRSWLIDTTPGTLGGINDRNDGALAIGRTYSDGNTHITPLARGGSTPHEFLDVKVNTGPFPGNVAPSVTLDGPSTISARQTCFLTANATDGNGDQLAYFWDFGLGFTFDNHPDVTVSWPSGGTYNVNVTVSDMKGNTAQATKTITVTDPITTWAARANSSVGDFRALVASPDKVIAVGTDYTGFLGPVASSSDGTTWSSASMPSYGQLYAGVWDGTQFLVAGEDYSFSLSGWIGAIYTSPTANTGTWTQRHYSGAGLRGIAFGSGVYVAVGGSGTILRSTNGINWTPVASGTTNLLSSIAYGGGKFVAVGYDSAGSGSATVLTSPDGLTWTNTSAGAGADYWQDLRYIAWTHDRFLASGWYGKLRHSTDLGTSFSTTRTTTEDTPALAYGNGAWFAAGIDKSNSDADIDLVSPDGINWTPLATPSLDDRNAAIFFKNTFITAGKNHSIRQSGTISPSANGYSAWRESNFPNHDALSTQQADGDGDGMSNMLEYSLGRSPVSSAGGNGPAALPRAVVASADPLLANRIAMELNLPEPAASDLIHVVEASSSLSGAWTPLATKIGTGTWTWNPGGTSRILPGTPAGGRVIVKIGDSLPISTQPGRFLRLKTYPNQ